MPTAPPRPPKQARAVLIPFYAADARSPPPAPSQIQNNVGEAGVPRWSLVLGLKLRALRVGAALLSPPSSRFPPSKTLSKQREAALVARNTMCSNQSRRLAEIGEIEPRFRQLAY